MRPQAVKEARGARGVLDSMSRLVKSRVVNPEVYLLYW
jgi:hypothetical protein